MTNPVNPPIAALSNVDLNTPAGKRAVIDLFNQIWLKLGGPVDIIENLEVTQTSENGGNRTYRHWRDDIDNLEAQVVETKRRNRALEQQIYAVAEQLGKEKSHRRQIEQKLNDLIEQVDTGV